MSSSSESEDENLKQILEAADTNFLTDSLFKTKPVETEILQSKSNEVLPSQRHITYEESTDIDFVPSETVQKIMAKKLSHLVDEQIEFVDAMDLCNKKPKKDPKSRVRLLKDIDCYVKPFEDFEYEDLGQRKKVKIKKRNVVGEVCLDEQTKHKLAAIDGAFVLSLKETVNWSERPKGKVYHYKQGKGINKDQHFIEPPNEFTKARLKNQWNESKIKKAKFSNK
ncbi:uncharacterized protein LOC129946052 [Eupeodes corollae]|uniref:uncharacterized protein LOC129946052 n=1 Tax=Eupeodes corollae TaxID=290404 RepID=UPI00248F6FA2|nr:uncharacterized protein LOC129946052 [Eupeodes corollae]